MKPLILRPLWMSFGIIGIGLVIFLSLTRMPHHMLRFPFGDKLEHVIAFGSIEAWFSQLYETRLKRLILIVSLLVGALGLEIGQRLLGGYALLEWGDVVASWVGIMLAGWLIDNSGVDGFLARLEGKIL